MTDSTVLPASYPSQLTGTLAPTLSRWLWLVKWLLAIPHYVVLFFLSIAALLTTIIAGFAILFTGRYPRGLFNFVVGVLRWCWRVSFYTYSALGTDQYPPFALARTNYPADFDVAYPEKLSRGLVLVKWWLLAIPHYLVVGVIAGTTYGSGYWQQNGETQGDGFATSAGLLALLVLIAAVVLLFTARYPQQLFAFIMGLNRWTWRVTAYSMLLTDVYPPFRLDQGSAEPERV